MLIAMRQRVARRPVLLVALILIAAIVLGLAVCACAGGDVHLHGAPLVGANSTTAGQIVATVMVLLGLLSLPRIALVRPWRRPYVDDHRWPPAFAEPDSHAKASPTLSGLCRIQV